MTILRVEEVIAQHLCGQSNKPKNLIDDSQIRPDGSKATSIPVDGRAFVDSAGRFALSSYFALVEELFLDLPLAPSTPPGIYNKLDLARIYGLSNS